MSSLIAASSGSSLDHSLGNTTWVKETPYSLPESATPGLSEKIS
jgi:hypothetical protein